MKMNCDARGSWSMNVACGILGVALVLIGPAAWGQTGESAATEKGNTASRQEVPNPRTDSRPFQTFYVTNASPPNDANEITIALRNLLPGDVKIYLVPSQNAITMRGTPDEIALAQKIISDVFQQFSNLNTNPQSVTKFSSAPVPESLLVKTASGETVALLGEVIEAKGEHRVVYNGHLDLAL